jgi:hypothetical protein
MTYTRTYTTVDVVLKPGMTIEGLIKKYNNYKVDRTDIEELVEVFNEINPQAQPPHPGMTVQVPVMPTCEN